MSTSHQPITEWAEDDRPREKLLARGLRSMTNAELLAILLRSGSRELSAVKLSQHILSLADNHLATLSRYSAQELMEIKGIGEAKALSIIAALELGRRRKSEKSEVKTSIKSSKDAFDELHPLIGDADYEEFWILILNRKNVVLRAEQISDGGVSGTLVDAKRVFKKALDYKASSLILAHNHPSGNNSPSHEDKRLTEKMVEAGKVLDIPVLDHIIVTADGYYSFKDEGLI
ncbi:MAG: DNA repair protein RadC [Flavobacteriales bacterium]|jgi:DNA repair protein RadC